MLHTFAILLTAAALAQPTGTTATPEAKTPPVAVGTPAPLTDAERPLVGRWEVDYGAYAKAQKEKAKAERDALVTIMQKMPFLQTISIELRGDHSALLACRDWITELRWRVEGNEVLFKGSESLKDVVMHVGKDAVTIDAPSLRLEKGTALRAAPKGKPVTAADLKGEWSVDPDLTLAATKAYWSELLGSFGPQVVEVMQASLIDKLPEKIAASPVAIRFDGDKANITAPAPAIEAAYVISADLIVLKPVPAGAKPEDRRYFVPVQAEGDTLRFYSPQITYVLKKEAAKKEPAKANPTKPGEPPSKERPNAPGERPG